MLSLPASRGQAQRTGRRVLPELPVMDPWLPLAAGLLLVLGLVMVASASLPVAERWLGQPFYFLLRQSVYVALGLMAAGLAFLVPVAAWYRRGALLLLCAFLLLVLVLVPGIGREINGSMRWIGLGLFNLQSSEPAKLLIFMYLACYLHRHAAALAVSTMALLRPMAVLGVAVLLLLLEPDFGAAVVLLAVALGLFFLAGVHLGRFIAVQAVTVAAMALLLLASPYRRVRLFSFLDPWENPYGIGFQLTQSLIAIGRGEWLGVGLGASVQKLFYLPEAHTDFVFAILAEELGFIGVVAVVGLYGVLVWRIFVIGARAQRLELGFAAWLAYAIGLWFAVQALVNMGVNLGVLPTKGLTLPLMSYGGSSLVVMCAALGVVLRIDVESRAQDPRLQRYRGARR